MATTIDIPIGKIVLNTGQIEGLPRNPRQIRDERYEKLKQSIMDAPEMLQMRELIVVEQGDRYVTICGNMRLRACRELGYKTLPCYVLPADTPAEKLREYTIKDNVPFGEVDIDALANEWDEDELERWGADVWATVEEEEETTENYTRKIQTPVYEPSPTMPAIATLADTTKYDALCAAIEGAEGLTDEERQFLLMAAGRHIVYNYEKIGDWYAGSSAAVQRLAEQSALVIIDYKRAIEEGFIVMTDDLLRLTEVEEEENDDDDGE